MASQQVDDWVDYLEEFRANHSAVQFGIELLLGVISHFIRRLFDERSVSVVLPLAGVVLGLVAVPGLAIAPHEVTFAASGDVHLGLGVAVLAVAFGRRPASLAADPFRIMGLLLVGTAFIHHLVLMERSGWQAFLPGIYFALAGLGTSMVGISALRSSMVLGCSRIGIALAVSGVGIGGLWQVQNSIVFGPSLAGVSAILAAVGLLVLSFGLYRMWLASNRIEDPPVLNAPEGVAS